MRNLIITFVLMLGFAVSANAQVYNLDFIGDPTSGADTFGERAVDDGTVLQFDAANAGGIYVQFDATSTSGEGYAYFDSGTAGLGVCTTTLGTQCNPTSDDNLTLGETMTLSFFDAQGNALNVGISSLVFRDASHNIITDKAANLLFSMGGDALVSTSMTGFGWAGMANSFNFGYDNQEYYISSMLVSEVPEPATWLMMIIGFGIVSAATRRSRRPSSIAHTC